MPDAHDLPADDPLTVPARDEPARAPRRHLLRTLGLLAFGVLVVDQVTKAWVLAALRPGERHPVLGDLLGVQLVFNPGAALSMATGMTWVLTLVAVAVVAVVVRVARRLGSSGWALALGLLLGGALGNLVDRLVREPGVGRGHVVDFIAYGHLFVGNVADIAIVAAAVLVVLLALLGVRLDGTREGVDREGADREDEAGEHAAREATAPDDGAPEPRSAQGATGAVDDV